MIGLSLEKSLGEYLYCWFLLLLFSNVITFRIYTRIIATKVVCISITQVMRKLSVYLIVFEAIVLVIFLKAFFLYNSSSMNVLNNSSKKKVRFSNFTCTFNI